MTLAPCSRCPCYPNAWHTLLLYSYYLRFSLQTSKCIITPLIQSKAKFYDTTAVTLHVTAQQEFRSEKCTA